MKKQSFCVLLFCLSVLVPFSIAADAKYVFDSDTPYNGVIVGQYKQTITANDEKGESVIYLPKGLQPWTPAVIILTPNHTTAIQFAESKDGQEWKKVADANLIALAFLCPHNGEKWNLNCNANERNDSAILSQLYMTMRSKSTKNEAPFSMDKSHTTLVGYAEGGAAALLFGTMCATEFSGIAAINATSIKKDILTSAGEKYVLPFPADTAVAIEEMAIKANSVNIPVWFINSADANPAALEYYIKANKAVKSKSNKHAETVYTSTASVAEIWISNKVKKPSVIYSNFLSKTKRFMGMQRGGRLALAKDFTDKKFTVYEKIINGEQRRWMTYVPQTYNPTKKTPLVVVMHGYTASMYAIAEESRWYDIAEENGFIVLFMQALVRETPMIKNIPAAAWIAGRFASMYENATVDVSFISDVIEMTGAKYNIDNGRIYATGHSNGAMMAAQLGMDKPNLFAAVAPVGYMIPSNKNNSQNMVPIWFIVGEYDSAVTAALIEGNNTVNALISWNDFNDIDENLIIKGEQYDGQWQTLIFNTVQKIPLVQYTVIKNTPHTYMPEESKSIWYDFFSKYNRDSDGTLYYQNKKLDRGTYIQAKNWYTAQ